ncbi:7TM diverse intracellular signaling domain-containing protein [Flavimarina sp. Hel_I_48]|uniref:7TM diverse intracellular signaling domain-containing protein n=1 Tax=Flavimarina sp. Hel_I_48 TaxID=1392488 RepID=UPI0004DEF1B5|nr:7TM diverse intracellular signaling domain-containing protein [Flavimarina sp. Hel_I_48]
MRYLCLLHLLLSFSTIQSQEILRYIRVEKNSNYNIDIENAIFNPLDEDNYGLKNGYYWIKVENTPSIDDEILSLEGHHILSVMGYTSRGSLLKPLENTRYPGFEINTDATFPLFIKVKLENEAYLPVKFYTRSYFEKRQQSILFSYGLFYGALIFICVIMIILFMVTGDDNFWTYAILLLCIGIALLFRDNIPYLFGWKDSFYYNLELATHILIGIFGGYFAYSFINLRKEKSFTGKMLIFIFATGAVLNMFLYWLLSDFIYYAIADTLIFLSILSLWISSFIVSKKNAQMYWVLGIFAVNIYFIFEFLVLYNFGLTLLGLSPAVIKIGILMEILIMCFALLNEWQRSKKKTLFMRNELNKRKEEIKMLSQYKREDDMKDIYLENLIKTYDLTDREVKILQLLSSGLNENHIARMHGITNAQLKARIKSLYFKIGISSEDEIDSI